MADIDALTKLIEPVVTANGFELVRVKMMTTEVGRTLQVMAEDPASQQLVIEQCTQLSRALSDVLDAEDPIEEEYHLEVSSPGIDRPLTRPKDFALWAGHKAKISMTEPLDGRKKFQGTLLGLDARDSAEFVQLRAEDGSDAVYSLPVRDIHSAKLVLTDELVDATRPQTLN